MSEVNEETLRAREALAGHYKEVLGHAVFNQGIS